MAAAARQADIMTAALRVSQSTTPPAFCRPCQLEPARSFMEQTVDPLGIGSVHIVDLPDPVAARAFAFDEPNYQAGAYRDPYDYMSCRRTG